jgi:hypothetical protein
MSTISELSHIFRAMKAPAAAEAREARPRGVLVSRALPLEAVVSTGIASRESDGGEARIKAARFPSRMTLEEVRLHLPALGSRRQVIEQLGQLDFLHGKQNVVTIGQWGDHRHCPRLRRAACPPRALLRTTSDHHRSPAHGGGPASSPTGAL